MCPFQKSAKELYDRLSRASATWELRNEAIGLADTFARFDAVQVGSQERVAAIQQLLNLHRRSLEYLLDKK